METKHSYAIKTLKGSQNFASWANQIKYVLKAKHLWEITTGEIRKPTVAVRATPLPEEESEPRSSADTAAAAINPRLWNARDAEASYWLTSTVSEEINRVLATFDTAHAQWTYLQQFKNVGFSAIHETLSKFINCRVSGDVERYCNEFQAIVNRLHELSPNSNQPLIAHSVILSTFLVGFGNRLPAFTALKQQEFQRVGIANLPRLADVISEAIEASRMDKQSSSSAFTATGKKKLRCSACDRDGHTEDRCWEKNPCDTCGKRGYCQHRSTKAKEKDQENTRDPKKLRGGDSDAVSLLAIANPLTPDQSDGEPDVYDDDDDDVVNL